eukprot:TRINITY_DN4181_c2_g1_i1.p1 TRINITY_DN4181_c2_g1~~TRINITY_DN4181_c2_g1_i1.p1  ORF type:complete len:1619 (+),score=526.58 TRINITY_DN4181_c2_g1_i1:75-4859(+)
MEGPHGHTAEDKARAAAAVNIQAQARGHLARKHAREQQAASAGAAPAAAEGAPQHTAGDEAPAAAASPAHSAGDKRRQDAAVLIQAQIRGHLARKRARELRSARKRAVAVVVEAERFEAAAVVQRCHRCRVAKRQRRLRRDARRAAERLMLFAEAGANAEVLQRAARCRIARKRVRSRSEERRAAWQAEDGLLIEQERHDAAAVIQSLWRGHRDRQWANVLRQRRIADDLGAVAADRDSAALVIQSGARMWPARRKVRRMIAARRGQYVDARRTDAALVIQTSHRASRERRKVGALRHARRQQDQDRRRAESAERIQSQERARRARGEVGQMIQQRRSDWSAEREAADLYEAAERLHESGQLPEAAAVLTAVARATEAGPALRVLRHTAQDPALPPCLRPLALALADLALEGGTPQDAGAEYGSVYQLLWQETRPAAQADADAATIQAFHHAAESRAAVRSRLQALSPRSLAAFPRLHARWTAEARGRLYPGDGAQALVAQSPPDGMPFAAMLHSVLTAELQRSGSALQPGLAAAAPGAPWLLLQRVGRGGTVRRVARWARRRVKAAVVLQRSFYPIVHNRKPRAEAAALRRERAAARQQAEREAQRTEAALSIQLCWRSGRAREQGGALSKARREERARLRQEMYQCEAEMTDGAARAIQRAARCLAARRRVVRRRREERVLLDALLAAEGPAREAERAAEAHAATRIQAWARALGPQEHLRSQRELWLQLKAQQILFDAVVTIQSGVRGRLARKRIAEERRHIAAAREIQRVARAMFAAREVALLRYEHRRRTAATRIQAQARRMFCSGELDRRRTKELLRLLQERRDMSAGMIQRVERGRQARVRARGVREHIERRRAAATRICAVARGFLARRGPLVAARRRRDKQLQDLTINAAAHEIGRTVHGHFTRCRLQKLRTAQHRAARTIQRVYRGHRGRRVARAGRERKEAIITGARREAASLVIQAAWRASAARGETRRRRYKRHEAERAERYRMRMAILLGSTMRGAIERGQLRACHMRSLAACVTLQRCLRGLGSRLESGPRAVRQRRLRSVLRVQRHWRRLRPKLEQLADERDMLRKFTRMQTAAVVRNEKGSRLELMLQRDEGLAKLLDTMRHAGAGVRDPLRGYRRFLAALPRRWATRAATRIQTAWRRAMARGRVQRLRAKRSRARPVPPPDTAARQRQRKGLPQPPPERKQPPAVSCAEEALRWVEEMRYERAVLEHQLNQLAPLPTDEENPSPSFRSLSTVPRRHQDWLLFFTERNLPMDEPLRRLLAEEASLRGNLELEAAVLAEKIALPMRTPPPVRQGWRAAPTPKKIPPKLLPPLMSSASDTIQLKLGDSIHNCPNQHVATAFGSPQRHTPLPDRARRDPLSPLHFTGLPRQAGLRAAAGNAGAAESLRRLVTLDDPAVTVVDLSGSGLTDQDVYPLLVALRSSRHVRTVDLKNNPLRDPTAEAIAQLLRVNQVVSSVDLSGTDVTDLGASHLSGAVEGNSTLRRLNLADSLVSASCKASISAALRLRALPPPTGQSRTAPALSRHQALKRRPAGAAALRAQLHASCRDVSSRPIAASIARGAVDRQLGLRRLPGPEELK